MRNFIGAADSPAIVALIARDQIAGISFITGIAYATPDQVGVPEIIRHAILTGTMRASVKLMPVERPRRLPHRRAQAVPRALRLLAELVEGPAVGAARGALKFFAREALK